MLYAIGAVLFGGLVTVMSRLTVARGRARRTAAAALPAGPIIVISNHASYADGIILALVCRRMGRSVRLLATSGVFRAPGLGWLVTRLGFIRVDRGTDRAGDSLDLAAAALEAGEAVGIFPEGRTTRNPDHWPEQAKTGAVRLALRTGAPIVPVAMFGTHRVLAKKRAIRSLVVNLALRPRVLVDVGRPVDVAALAEANSVDPDDARALSDLVMAELVSLVEELRGEIAPAPSGVTPED